MHASVKAQESNCLIWPRMTVQSSVLALQTLTCFAEGDIAMGDLLPQIQSHINTPR